MKTVSMENMVQVIIIVSQLFKRNNQTYHNECMCIKINLIASSSVVKKERNSIVIHTSIYQRIFFIKISHSIITLSKVKKLSMIM